MRLYRLAPVLLVPEPGMLHKCNEQQLRQLPLPYWLHLELCAPCESSDPSGASHAALYTTVTAGFAAAQRDTAATVTTTAAVRLGRGI